MPLLRSHVESHGRTTVAHPYCSSKQGYSYTLDPEAVFTSCWPNHSYVSSSFFFLSPLFGFRRKEQEISQRRTACNMYTFFFSFFATNVTCTQ
jgi:hypothetical protein